MVDTIKEGYTRVSAVLSPFAGYGNIDKAVLENAAYRGTCVHESIDAIIEGFEPDPLENGWELYVDSFRKWNVGKRYIAKPNRFYDDEFMITGECDAIYKQDDGTLVLVDFKTSACVSKTWALQGAAYKHMSCICNGFELDKIEFVKLCKKGGEPKIFTYYGGEWELFVTCLRIYREFFENQKFVDIEDL